MKEKTKKNLKENMELLVAVLISGALVYQMNTCTSRSNAKSSDDKAKKTVVTAPKDSVNVNNARLNMIGLHNIKSR